MDSENEHMLASLRKLHSSRRVLVPRSDWEPVVERPPIVPASYKTVELARATGEALGIASPFYRMADAVDGTRIKISQLWCENFSSYDYLGVNTDPRVSEAVAEAAHTWGVSSTASRLAGGERRFHSELEADLARFLGYDDCLVMVSGHATNQAIIRTLVEPGDLVLVDALSHNSIYEGIRASGAKHLSFPHNDFDWVEARLRDIRGDYGRVMISIEGLYSMDGDAPDLASFIDVKNRHGALLMVDEAHSIGVLGATGRGICEEQGVPTADVDILMGTLSKTFCACGGFVAGSRELIDAMKFLAPGFVYSVGLSAPVAAAATTSLRILAEEPERVARLRKRSSEFLQLCRKAGLDTGLSQGYAVGPIVVGDSLKATKLSNMLLKQGIHVIPVIFPGVPEKTARLRFFITAAHSADALAHAVNSTAQSLSSL